MTKTNRFFIFFIFIFGTTIGLFYLFSGPVFPVTKDSDSATYDNLALNLINGKGFSLDGTTPTARDVPTYPFFLAGIYKIFGHNFTAVRIIQILMVAGIGTLIYLSGKKYLGLPPKFSFLAGCLVVVWPYFVLYSTLILTEIIYTFFLTLTVFSLLEFHQSFSKKSVAISGFSLAIASLARPVAFFLPLWLIFFWIIARRNKEIFRKHLLILLIFILALSPWMVRNFIHFQAIIPTADWFFPMIAAVFVEDAGDTYFQPLTKNPAESIKSRLKNILLFWNPGAQGTRAQKLLEINPGIRYFFLGYRIIFFLILLLALLSLFYIKRKEIFLLWCIIFYFWLVHAAILPYPRYTLPIIPLIILLALFSQVKLWTSLKARAEIPAAKS